GVASLHRSVPVTGADMVRRDLHDSDVLLLRCLSLLSPHDFARTHLCNCVRKDVRRLPTRIRMDRVRCC
ncbi:hypothetical protein AAVH_21155, partial [Aphelenchoides avenae]